MTVKIYKPSELTNEDYQQLPQISGSDLVKVIQDCVAMWKFGERKETPALFEGTASHALTLEPETFDDLYFRDIDSADYPDALKTNKDLEGFIKSLGVKGYSGKKKEELLKMIDDTGETPQILSRIVDEWHDENLGKDPIKAADYDRMMGMRAQLFRDPEIKGILTGAAVEMSLVSETRKCRIDIIPGDRPEIWDYKTVRSAHPDNFGKAAHDLGYWVKMAWQAEIFHEFYGVYPAKVGFIVQDKNYPYIPQTYEMSPEQLQVGREQAEIGEKLIQSCIAKDSYPAYGGGIQPLRTPGYLAKRYGFDE